MVVRPDLKQILQYKHPQVIAAFKRDHPNSAVNAEDLFQEMLKFLWISWKHAHDKKEHPYDESLNFLLVMHEEMREIDNMWHNFILYTRDYTDFCMNVFGEYFHHEPDIAETNPQSIDEFTEDLEKFLFYTYDQLGEATVRSWFAPHLAN